MVLLIVPVIERIVFEALPPCLIRNLCSNNVCINLFLSTNSFNVARIKGIQREFGHDIPLLPESEKINKDLDVSKDKIGVNALEAITSGTTDGLKLAVNVGAMLLVFTSLIALLNYFVFKIGDWTSLNALIESGGMYDRLSFESISGYLLSPLAWVLGVEWQDAMYFGQLLGEKTIINEFIAYPHLGDIQDELSNKTVIMATYVLCGFANIVSIGIQVGGIGILIPNKKSMLARLGWLALIGGTLACMSTSVLAGMLY